MDLGNFHPSEIVQIPAIVKGGMVRAMTPDMNQLSDEQLKDMARVIGGDLVFLKMRATYTDPGHNFCIHKDCFALAEKDSVWCGKHAR